MKPSHKKDEERLSLINTSLTNIKDKIDEDLDKLDDLKVDIGNIVEVSDGIKENPNFRALHQNEYDNISSKENDKIYFIYRDNEVFVDLTINSIEQATADFIIKISDVNDELDYSKCMYLISKSNVPISSKRTWLLYGEYFNSEKVTLERTFHDTDKHYIHVLGIDEDGNIIGTAISSNYIKINEIPFQTDFSYTGKIQSVTLPAGTYQLECWGAEGRI